MFSLIMVFEGFFKVILVIINRTNQIQGSCNFRAIIYSFAELKILISVGEGRIRVYNQLVES